MGHTEKSWSDYHTREERSQLEKCKTKALISQCCLECTFLVPLLYWYLTLLKRWKTMWQFKKSHFENQSHLRKWVTLRKVCSTWKNTSLFEKWVTLEKVGHTDGSHLGKWITLGKMGLTWANRSHSEKGVILGGIRHTSKNRSHVEKWVTFAKMGHTWKNGSHLDK